MLVCVMRERLIGWGMRMGDWLGKGKNGMEENVVIGGKGK